MNKQFEFKVGDTVRILKASSKHGWSSCLDPYIGKTFNVVEVTKDCVIVSVHRIAFEPECLEFINRKQEPKSDKLTQAELQFLTKGFTHAIRKVEENIFFYKGKVAHTWKYCIPNSSEAYLEFPRLNSLKDALRKEKETLKKLSEIQRKLKKQQGN